jgi:hypothetical protein
MTIQPTETSTEAATPAELSFVFSTGGAFCVTPIRNDDDRPLGARRIRIDAGPMSVFITRKDVPALIDALLVALAGGKS